MITNCQYFKTSMLKIGAIFCIIFFISNCSNNNQQPISLNWQEIKSITSNLPDGIRIYAGINNAIPLRAWYVYIEEKRPDIYTRIVVSDDNTDKRESASSFAQDLNARVVINGGFFRYGKNHADHVGLLLSDGKIIKPATRSIIRDSIRYETARAAIGFTNLGEVDICWVTSRNNSIYAWSTPPFHLPGQPDKPLDYQEATKWEVRDALSAGPALVINGEIQVTIDQEVFFNTPLVKNHPRTAIGYTAEGALLMLVVDGRQPSSRGVNLFELAKLIYDLGAVEALNLDGGGSSTLVVNNELINRPLGQITEREVVSAIATFCIQ
jgi:exopolysaccharide biosynthesis protein